MAEDVLEKQICSSCGADVREGTQFCYSCGKPVAGEPDASDQPESTDDAVANAETIAILPDDKTEKKATAAAERKKSRLGQRKPKQIVWEEPPASTNRLFILFCLLMFVLAAGVVFITIAIK